MPASSPAGRTESRVTHPERQWRLPQLAPRDAACEQEDEDQIDTNYSLLFILKGQYPAHHSKQASWGKNALERHLVFLLLLP